MGKIPIRQDNEEYASLLKSTGPNRERTVTESELKALSSTAYIVTGLKTVKYGGGESPDGFVVTGRGLLGRIRIKERAKDGAITV